MNARELLEQTARMHDELIARGTRLYNFDRWLLDYGEAFGPLVTLDGLELGEPKQCYMNAAKAVLDFEVDPDEWFYTEGVMVVANLPIPIHHAWLSNREGQVLELTSRAALEHGATYWGVPFQSDWLRMQLLRQGFWGLFSDGCTYQPITHGPLGDERAWPLNRREAA